VILLYRGILSEEFIRGTYGEYSGDLSDGAAKKLAAPCMLVQNPGELVYVPRHWSHQVVAIVWPIYCSILIVFYDQVLNLEETIGFAVEVLDYI
jgi:hypothetical protein